MTSSSVKTAHDLSAAPRTLLLRLKDETRDVPESLERDLKLVESDLTLDQYRIIVERFYGFYEPWERAIEPLLTEHLPGYANSRAKAPRLVEDLRALKSSIANLPLCDRLPDCANWPAVLGSLYVTEGATLGGQIVSRRLQQKLGLSPRAGISFFWSYGMDVSSMWRNFCAMLLAHAPPSEDDVVVRAARQTAEAMHEWLCMKPK